MTTHTFVPVEQRSDLERCYPLMKELREGLPREDFFSLHDAARAADGYKIVAIEEDGQYLALMGYRILHDFVHGKHLYIDDLVATASRRSQGLGAKLLEHAEAIAHSEGCKNLRLCTGIANEGGKKFYERNGWDLRSVVYKKKI